MQRLRFNENKITTEIIFGGHYFGNKCNLQPKTKFCFKHFLGLVKGPLDLQTWKDKEHKFFNGNLVFPFVFLFADFFEAWIEFVQFSFKFSFLNVSFCGWARNQYNKTIQGFFQIFLKIMHQLRANEIKITTKNIFRKSLIWKQV